MPKRRFSLTVVMRPARGRLRDLGPISTQNLAATAPAAETVRKAQQYFAARQCEVLSSKGGISFTIEAGEDILTKLFDAKELTRMEAAGGELSLRKLPRDIQELLEAVTFSKPPDFGPGNFA